MRDGLGSAMVGLGRPNVTDLCRDDLVVPSGFEQRLGETAVARACEES